MNNQKIITKILKEKSKGLRKFLKSQDKLVQRAKAQTDEEWSLKNDPVEGRKKKDLMVEASQFTIGYITALSDLIPEMIDLLGKSEKQIRQMQKDEQQKEKQRKKKERKAAEKEIVKTKIVKLQEKEQHIEWCPLYGTGKKWAVDPDCSCPGASVVRKRMKKGATLEEAKRYIADKGLDVMF